MHGPIGEVEHANRYVPRLLTGLMLFSAKNVGINDSTIVPAMIASAIREQRIPEITTQEILAE